MRLIQSKYLGYLVLIFFIFFLAWSFGPMKSIEKKLVNATGSKEMLDLKPSSGPDEIYTYVDKIGEPGRGVLKEMYSFQDLVYPLAYGLFFLLALLYFISRSFPGKNKLLWLSLPAFFMMIADYLENFSLLMILSHPAERSGLANYVGTFTTIKWLLGAVAIVLFLMFGFSWMAKKLFRKNNANA